MLRTIGRIALLVTLVPAGAAAQDAKAVIANASKAMGADNVNSITVLGFGVERQLRTEQDHCRPAGDHDHHELHARDRSHRARVARHRRDHAAGDSGRAAAATGNVHSEHHARQRRMDAAAGNLGHAVGLPEGRRGQQRDGPLSADRRQDVQRRVVDRRRRRRHRDSRTGSTATSTIRTWSSASRPGSSTPLSAICMSTPRTATTRTSAG